jgi:uncharacterized protein
MSTTSSKTDQLNQILEGLEQSLAGEINGSAIVSTDGIVYAARFASTVNVDRVGAIAATTLGVSGRVARDLALGNNNETIIQCDNGFFVILPVNSKCLLAVNLRKGGNLGMTRLEANDTAAKVRLVMN